MRSVYIRTGETRSRSRCLNNGVLFGVNPATEFMTFTPWNFHLFTKTAYFQAMGETLRSPVIARCQDALVYHDQGADLATQTGGTRRNEACDLDEISIPGWTVHRLNEILID
jgi:hypothetical protein